MIKWKPARRLFKIKSKVAKEASCWKHALCRAKLSSTWKLWQPFSSLVFTWIEHYFQQWFKNKIGLFVYGPDFRRDVSLSIRGSLKAPNNNFCCSNFDLWGVLSDGKLNILCLKKNFLYFYAKFFTGQFFSPLSARAL